MSDIGSNFKNIQNLFQSALEYLVTKGLIGGLSSSLYIDSNAVECFSNFSAECYDLFTRDLILPILQVCDTVLPNLKSNLADKLIEALLNIIGKLPSEELGVAVRRVLAYVVKELQSLSLDDSSESKQKYSKCVIIWASALNSLSSLESSYLDTIIGDLITQALDITCQGLILYKSQDGIIAAASLFFRRIIKALNNNADPFFPMIGNCVLQCYSPGNEECLAVISNAISLIGREINTEN